MPSLREEVIKWCGVDAARCYQCGRCTSACPVARFMDLPPARMVKGVLSGAREELLSCGAIWVCTSCQACTTRCPQQIDVASLIACLTNHVLAEGLAPGGKQIVAWHEAFLENLRRRGRIREARVALSFARRRGLAGVKLERALALLIRGRLPFSGGALEDMTVVKNAFELELESEAGGQ